MPRRFVITGAMGSGKSSVFFEEAILDILPMSSIDNHKCFSQTEICAVLSLVNGCLFQSLQRSRSLIPTSLAIKSSSDGQTYRNGKQCEQLPGRVQIFTIV